MALAVSEFQLLLVQLAADLGIKLTALIAHLDKLDQREQLAFITEAYPELARAYLAASGEVSVQWYNEQPTTSAFIAETVDLIPDERLAASGRWALLQTDPVKALMGSAQRAVMDQSRETIVTNVDAEYEHEPTDKPLGTRWARHASANACGFCRMLATRGAIYRNDGVVYDAKTGTHRTVVKGRSVDPYSSDERAIRAGALTRDQALENRSRYVSARQAAKVGKMVGDLRNRPLRGTQKLGEKYHDHCHCIAVPVRPGGFYEPPDYVEQWQDDYIAASRQSMDPKVIARLMEKDAADGGAEGAKVEYVEVRYPPDANGYRRVKRVVKDSGVHKAAQQSPEWDVLG